MKILGTSGQGDADDRQPSLGPATANAVTRLSFEIPFSRKSMLTFIYPHLEGALWHLFGEKKNLLVHATPLDQRR